MYQVHRTRYTIHRTWPSEGSSLSMATATVPDIGLCVEYLRIHYIKMK